MNQREILAERPNNQLNMPNTRPLNDYLEKPEQLSPKSNDNPNPENHTIEEYM